MLTKNGSATAVLLLMLVGASHGQDAANRPVADVRFVSFVSYEEEGEWKTWKDTRLSIRIPKDWIIAIDARDVDDPEGKVLAENCEANEAWTYRLIRDDERVVVCSILVCRGGSEFIKCFCAPQEVHEYSKQGEFKIWALTLPSIPARTFKVASATMRLDIHAKLPNKNPERIRYIVESARTIEFKNKAAK